MGRDYKQVILVREDLKLSKGKMAAQVSHAAVDCLLKSHKDDMLPWKEQGMKKVILKVKDLDELLKYKEEAEDAKLMCCLIRDQGRTEVMPGTITCLGIGPDREDKIDKVTGDLKMM